MPFDLGYPPVQSRLARPGYDGTSLQEVARRFPTDDACLEHVMETRFGHVFACLQCGRTSAWHRRRGAKYFQHSCGAVISPLGGTLFHGTKLPLRLWFYAMLHFANSQEGVNVGFLSRHLGISYLAAFRMAQRIRWHMSEIERAKPIASPHQEIEVRVETIRRVRSGNTSPNRATIVFVARDGKVDCEVISSCRRHIALRAVSRMLPNHGGLRTTCHHTARLFSAYGMRIPRATYLPCYYLDHPDEIDAIKGFQSYFLWPFHTHHKHASRAHVWLYLKEFQFRYNRRERSADTYWDMVNAFPDIVARGAHADVNSDPATES